MKPRVAEIYGKRLKQNNTRWAFEKCPSATGLSSRGDCNVVCKSAVQRSLNFEYLSGLETNLVCQYCLKMYRCQTQPQDMVNGGWKIA